MRLQNTKTELKRPWIRVRYPDTGSGKDVTYGGNQKRHPVKSIQTDGCGPLAAGDLLSYLEQTGTYENAAYEQRLVEMSRSYFPYKEHHGTSGFVIAGGLNRYFRTHQLPYRAAWALPRFRLYDRMAQMLQADLPVILTVGPHFPGIPPKHKLALYQKNTAGAYVQTNSTGGHYMVVTGMTRDWLRVSSWGEVYYINRREYLTYARRYSLFLFTNIVQIRPYPRSGTI